MDVTKVCSKVECNRKTGLAFLLGWLLTLPLQAVIFYSTADPVFNSTEPTGQLAGSGWQWQGQWGSFLGTPITTNLFVTAKHVGGNVGDLFVFQGVQYHTHAFFDDPDSDLRIWQVCSVFPIWATLYDRSDELGKDAVVMGRGTQRGKEIRVSGSIGGDLKGWAWGTSDGVQRWGENVVGSIVTTSGALLPPGSDASTSALLKFPFNANAGVNEATLSAGDSGGGVFISDGSDWKLAGISFAVDSPYNTSASGVGFSAAVFDSGGLYVGGDGQWTFTVDLVNDRPGAFYATSISSRLNWIHSVIAAQAGVLPVPLLETSTSVDGPWTIETPVSTDAAQQTLTATTGGMLKLYRLRHCLSLRLLQTVVTGNGLVIHYGDARNDF